MSCHGCGGQEWTGGCANPTCAFSPGGTYINGVKVRTASGRSLVPETGRVGDAEDTGCYSKLGKPCEGYVASGCRHCGRIIGSPR
jgi:hypothetical protein